MTAQDQFSNWRRRLAGETVEVVEGEPQAGFYRNRRKGKQASAICYWRDSKNGALRCHDRRGDVPPPGAPPRALGR